ncbi:bifunctional oligoribonuclease/PAP phosphatase NrnA [Nonomuraea phyllanthi]|uniref:Bifunctional oligoribonuclease/PAP phosphatase NrnA n=1 Tax=Nonomuraea phyllanthi TaxID=2219224 RepID=A0A5C4V7P4_9ACTN|nr:bifunctional oligoribonuclease/PAP phosphatase NrnA [Nonomuraea phyllanthi]KAB8187500.1 bifunctional oligoribonuclease/PAP phosphatase NrnA [Nonomuraea phyllanthi]QFY07070.1 bifunctional oligoribonuclease/PAP phosphatase NrnA [Nonomuraea phyllanthi]
MTPDVRDGTRRASHPRRVSPGAGATAVPEAAWDRTLRLIGRSEEVALACHVTPDGDALGSMLAVGFALRSIGKRVVASFGDRHFAVPRLLRFLPGQEMLVPPAEFPAAPELLITFDVSTFERLGLLRDNTARAGEVIVIDHHPSNEGFGTLSLIDSTAAATAVLAEQLIYRLGGRLDRDIATCLYAGLVTDTGSFKHASTTSAVHQMAARLVATGLRTDEIARELWDRSPFGYLKVLSAALDRAVLEDGVVWTYVSRVDRAAQGLPYAELEGIIDIVRRTDEAEVAVVLKEDDHGDWQVSTRSKGRADVGSVCAALGGGGHHNAAGYTSHDSVEQTMAAFRRELGKV